MPPHRDPAATNVDLREKIASLSTQRAELVLSLQTTMASKMSDSESTNTKKGKGRATPTRPEDENTPQKERDVEDTSAGDATTTGTEANNDAKDILEAANQIVKRHIELLHSYNEIRDVGQGLLGLIAEARGARVVDLYNEFGLKEKD